MPHLERSSRQNVERVSLMFQHHQRDHITVWSQVLRRVEAVFEFVQIVAGRVVDRFRFLCRGEHEVAEMLLIPMPASDIPSAPALIEWTLVSRHKAARCDDRMTTGVRIDGPDQYPGDILRPRGPVTRQT